jgi:molecular chaperone DnaK
VSDPIVGIDLGTSNTVVAHAGSSDVVQVLADGNGYKIHPSVVSFHPTGGVVVGAAAKQRKVIDPKNTIYSVKRLIGRTFNSKEVQTAKQRAPFQIKEGANQLPLIVTRGGEFAVPEISAIVLDHAKNIAKTALGTEVTRAVVTVPASFNDAQRSATATAGSIAGLSIVRVLNEPTAAALAYGNTRNLRETIAVFDFGGGTFDITILKLADNVYEVLGTAGDTFLGGDDLDERLVDRMVEKFLMENRVDLRQNEVSMMRLRAVAEQVKIELSRRSRAMVRIDEIAYGPKGKPLDLQIEIKRDEFVRQVADIIDRTFPVCEEALKYANLTIDHIDDVILVGGTTKIPYVRDQVAKFFAKAPRTDVNPEDAVAVGAALQANALQRMLDKKSASRPVPVQTFDSSEGTFGGETASREATVTYPEPLRTELERGNEPALNPSRPGERAAAKGAHHDVFEDRTPPPVTPPQPVIGRMTRPVAPPPAAKTAKPPLPPRQTQPVPVVRPPRPPTIPPSGKIQIPARPTPPSIQMRPASPASTLRGIAPVHQEEETGTGSDFQDLHTNTSVADVDPALADGSAALAEGSPDRADGDNPSFANLPTTRDSIPRMPPPPVPSTTARGFAAAMPLAPPTAPTIMAPPTAPTIMAPPTAPTIVAPQAIPVMPAPAPTRSHPQTLSPVVMDVTPRGLGIGTVAGFCEELIRRNARLPTEIRRTFTTSRDSQDSVRIIVCQGESRRLDNNVVIGDLRLENLPPRPRGETSIEVTFQLDASGILQVRARDAQTGREQRASLDIVGTIQAQDVEAAREKLQALRR